MSTDIRSETIEYDRYDVRNAFDLVMGDAQAFPSRLQHLVLKMLKRPMSSESVSALLYFSFDERVFNWL